MALKNMKEQLPQAFALTRLTKITIKENFSSSKMVSEEFCQKKNECLVIKSRPNNDHYGSEALSN